MAQLDWIFGDLEARFIGSMCAQNLDPTWFYVFNHCVH